MAVKKLHATAADRKEANRLACIKYRERHKEKIKKAQKKYREENKEKLRVNALAIYYNKKAAGTWNPKPRNKEKNRLTARLYVRAHAEKYKAHCHKRRALLKGENGSYTKSDVHELLKLQNYKCAYCKTSIRKTRHIDHIIPLSKGGNNSRKNIQLTCPDCNRRKSAKDPSDYARQCGLLI